MSDTMTVKRACEHGRYENHAVPEPGVGGTEPRCPGGKEIILDKEFLLRSEFDTGRWLWVVEVDGNE